jgi:hypothetical protein
MYEDENDTWYDAATAAPAETVPRAPVAKKRKRDAAEEESASIPDGGAAADEGAAATKRARPDLSESMDDSKLLFRVTTTDTETLQKLFQCMKEIAGNTHISIQCSREGMFISGQSSMKDEYVAIHLRQFHQLYMREGHEVFRFSVYPKEFVKTFANCVPGSSISYVIREDAIDQTSSSPFKLVVAIVHEPRAEIMFHTMRLSQHTPISSMLLHHEYTTQIRCTAKELLSMSKRFTLEKERSSTKPTFIQFMSHQSHFSASCSNQLSDGFYDRDLREQKELHYVREDAPDEPISVMLNYKSLNNLLKCSVLNIPCVIMLHNNMPIRLKFELGRQNEANFFLQPANPHAMYREKSDAKSDL